jgi:hypothetical protein
VKQAAGANRPGRLTRINPQQLLQILRGFLFEPGIHARLNLCQVRARKLAIQRRQVRRLKLVPPPQQWRKIGFGV